MVSRMDRIGRYEIVGELGRGAMGIVYRALDPAIGRTVAVKTIHLHAVGDESERARQRERLRREAQSAGVLSHPGIVTIYDIVEEQDTAYIFMEFVDGVTLEKRVTQGPLLQREAILDILKQTAEALDYAHSKCVVHRDIKPANLMLRVDGQVKITDFGVARLTTNNMTQAGAILGTPNYMSPEQLQGRVVNGTADQYSLAVIAYELLAGERPYHAESLPTLIFRILSEQPPDPRRLNPSLPNGLTPLLERALSKAPEQRFANCLRFIEALETCLATTSWQPLPRGAADSLPTVAGASVAPPPQPTPAAATKRRIPVLSTAVLIGLLVFGAGFGWFFVKPYLPEIRAALFGTPVNQPAQTNPQPPAPAPQTEAQPPSQPAADPGEAPEPPQSIAAETPAKAKQEPGQLPEPELQVRPGAAPLSGETHATLRLSSAPNGAEVVVDNDRALMCTTPCSLSVPIGERMLSYTLEGYRRAVRRLEVKSDLSVSLDLERMLGQLAIRTSPAGAAIYVDGQLQTGRTPTIITLPAGLHRIRLTREGLPDVTDEIRIRDNVITTYTYDWGRN